MENKNSSLTLESVKEIFADVASFQENSLSFLGERARFLRQSVETLHEIGYKDFELTFNPKAVRKAVGEERDQQYTEYYHTALIKVGDAAMLILFPKADEDSKGTRIYATNLMLKGKKDYGEFNEGEFLKFDISDPKSQESFFKHLAFAAKDDLVQKKINAEFGVKPGKQQAENTFL